MKRTTIRKYLPGAKEPYSETVDYEYGEWIPTGGRKMSNTLTSADDDAWFRIAPGSSIGVNISLDPPSTKKTTTGGSTDTSTSTSDSTFKDPVAVEAEQGFDFSTVSRVDTENNAQWVQGAGINQRNLLGGIQSPVNVGDIIVRPGIDILDVQKSGFGLNPGTDFFKISAEELRQAKLRNSPGDIPDDWDFLVITDISDTRHSGSKEFSYSTLHTWVNSYKIAK